MSKRVLLLLLLSFSVVGYSHQFIGQPGYGSTIGIKFGHALAINADATIAVVNAKADISKSIGQRIQTFQFINNAWELLGNIIQLPYFSYLDPAFEVAINAKGDRMAVTNLDETRPSNLSGPRGVLRIYHFDEATSDWVMVYQNEGPGQSHTAFGRDVDMNDAGDRVIVGSDLCDDRRGDSTPGGGNSGCMGVFTADENGVWRNAGYIYGDGTDTYFGRSVAISGDGMVAATSTVYKQYLTPNNLTWIRIYDISNLSTLGNPVQLGQQLIGSTDNRIAAGHIGLNENGTVLTTTNPDFNDQTVFGSAEGSVIVYEYISGSNTWVQKGQQLTGEGRYQGGQVPGAGLSHADISADGNRLVVGAPQGWDGITMDGDSIVRNGYIELYTFNTFTKSWRKEGDTVYGPPVGNNHSNIGLSRLSADGNTIVTSSPTLVVPALFPPAPNVGGLVSIGRDSDSDGVANSIEQAAGNSGDVNQDGVLDQNQANVVSFNDAKNNAFTVAASGNCYQFDQAQMIDALLFPATDTPADYPVGFLTIQLTCAASGESGTVTLYLDNAYDTNDWQFKSYHADSESYYDITDDVIVGIASIDANTVTTISFNISDNNSVLDNNSKPLKISATIAPLKLTDSEQTNNDSTNGGGYVSHLLLLFFMLLLVLRFWLTHRVN